MLHDPYMNSKNVTAANLAAQNTAATLAAQAVEFVQAPAVVVAPPPAKTHPQRWASFHAGFDAYCKGLSLADLSDRDEIRGWWSALDTGADCETDGYLHSQDPGPSIEDDARFLAYEF